MTEEFVSAPVFECFTIELKPGLDPQHADRAREALEEVLGGEAEGWSTEPVHASRPLMFDLLPPQEGALDVKQAWDTAYRLRLHPSVIDAEPSFEMLLDNVPDPEELESEEAPEALRRAVLEADEDEDPLDAAGFFAESTAAPEGPAQLDDSHPEWCPRLVQAFDAWQRPPRPQTGAQRGRDVVIAHPDSGFRPHDELFSPGDERVMLDRDRNFVERDRPDDAEHQEAGHGLGTASVIMSRDNPLAPADREIVTGAAPEARLVPMRVAKKRFLVPVPVLLSSGTRRLREAVFAAIEEQCHVISISLGWLFNRSLHEAIKEAVGKNIIVCAAAGNYVRFVVWPAHYPETIAVAGCTARRTKWKGSSRGKRVDVTAPAKNVWKATVGGDGRFVATRSKGTSYSVAVTAGLAALWLAHWGRDFLIQTYGGEFTLTTVFRRLLKATCDPPPPNHRGKFGSGIVNANRLLRASLPTLEELRASSAPEVEMALAVPAPPSMRATRAFADVFEDRPPQAVRQDLGELLQIPDEELDGHLPAVGDELMFHLLTNPALRERFLMGTDETAPTEPGVQAGLLMSAEALPGGDARGELMGLGLSDRLRRVAE